MTRNLHTSLPLLLPRFLRVFLPFLSFFLPPSIGSYLFLYRHSFVRAPPLRNAPHGLMLRASFHTTVNKVDEERSINFVFLDSPQIPRWKKK